MMKEILIAALFTALAAGAAAGDQIKICARYYRPSYDSWSKTYKLTAYHLNGTEASQAVGSIPFDAARNYVVISWKGNDFTAIEVPDHWDGTAETVLKDHKKRPWRLVKGWGNCTKKKADGE